MAISTSYALLKSIFFLISFYGEANCQLRCDRGVYASIGDNCESLAAKCNISQIELFYHNGDLVGGVHCNSIPNGQFACCVLWQGGVTTLTIGQMVTCHNQIEYGPPPLLDSIESNNGGGPILSPRCEDSSYWVIIHTVIGFAFLLIAFLLCLLGRNIHLHNKKRDQLLKLARKRLLRSGYVERINPEIPIEEQVDLLPYNLK